MKKLIIVIPVIFAFVLGIHAPQAVAQCNITYYYSNINSVQGVSYPYGAGQSFTACQTGFVAYVTVFSQSTTDVTAVLGTQAGTNINVRGNPQNVVLRRGGNRIELVTPLQVVAGGTYSFGLFPPSNVSLRLSMNPENPYDGGVKLSWSPYNGSSTDPAKDYLFGVEILPYNPVADQDTAWGSIKALYR